jgi:hypothetical protein
MLLHNALRSGSVLFNRSFWSFEMRGMTEEQMQPLAVDVLRAVCLDPDQVLGRDRDELSGEWRSGFPMHAYSSWIPSWCFATSPPPGLIRACAPQCMNSTEPLMKRCQRRVFNEHGLW